MSRKNGHDRPPWIIRTYAGFGSAEETNARFHENLNKGQTGLSVAFDLPTQNGYDPDAPMAVGEVGGCGVSVAHLGDMEALFHGIDLGSVNTSMTINATAPFLLALYLALAQKRGVLWGSLHGTVQNDLLKEFVARGTSIFTPAVSLRLSTDVITFAAEIVPHWNPVNVCGYHYAESGAGPYEEIGYAFGNALIILDAIRPRLSRPLFETVVRRISFFISSGIELIPELCKMRAYSRLWTELCRSEYGVDAVPFRSGCQVRSVSLTATQPENNIVRIALEALPALLSAQARVNALQLPGFREALSLPDEMEQTLSLRTQQILMHETKITDFQDIFEGNSVVEGMTSAFVEKARAIALEMRHAGYCDAISFINTELTKAMVERQRRIDTGDDIVVGLNEYPDPVGLSEQLSSPPPTTQGRAFEEQRIADLEKWKQKRDRFIWEKSRDRLANVVSNGVNTMYATVDFAKAGGTVGEWTSLIESATSGRYTVPMSLDAIGTNGSKTKAPQKLRVVLGKAGLDGHNNAIKLLAVACRNAGMEVIFFGAKLCPASLLKAAIEEGAHILGISCLSGGHLRIAREILTQKEQFVPSSLKFAIGGTIPREDKQILLDMGVDLVIPTDGSKIDDIVERIILLGSS